MSRWIRPAELMYSIAAATCSARVSLPVSEKLIEGRNLLRCLDLWRKSYSEPMERSMITHGSMQTSSACSATARICTTPGQALTFRCSLTSRCSSGNELAANTPLVTCELGTLNAVRLCLDALAPTATEVVVVLNRFDPTNDLHRRNLEWLAVRDGATVVTDTGALAERLSRERP